VFPDACVHAFEAFPDAYRSLRERYEDDDRVECIQTAVADAVGEETFHLNHADATNSLLPRPDETKAYYPSHAGAKGTMTVQSTPLDRYAEEQDIETVDILKMDIQGGGSFWRFGEQRTGCGAATLLSYTVRSPLPRSMRDSHYCIRCGASWRRMGIRCSISTTGVLRRTDSCTRRTPFS
jgi:FkbM family methyltransferase